MENSSAVARCRLVLVGVILALVVASCGLGGDDSVSVEDGTDRPGPVDPAVQEARSLAEAASFAADGSGTERLTPDGVGLSVDARYFEPLVVGDWTAPEECAYDALVGVVIDGGLMGVASPPLTGPTSNNDVDHDGVLGAVMPTTDPATGDDALLVLVVPFAHDAVVSMSLTDPPADTPYADLDTQPADGWTPLALLAPSDAYGDASVVNVTVSYESEAGETESTTLELPKIDDGDELGVLTDGWIFDETQVGEQCVPPPDAGPPLNEPVPPEVGLGGGTIGVKPTLPDPGDAPSDPVSATAAVLASIRTVYDIDDLYAEEHVQYMENPELALRIIREIKDHAVVEPYMSRLDPVFDSVVFTGPTEASVLYRVGPSYHWEIGRVLFIDGTWRVALGTFCRDLSDADLHVPGCEVGSAARPTRRWTGFLRALGKAAARA